MHDHGDALRSMLRRAGVRTVDDGGTQQRIDLSGLAGEQPGKVPALQPHGFSSHPPAGSEGLLLALGGRSDRLFYADGGHRDHRPQNTPAGAAMLYDTAGNVIFAKVSGVQVRAKNGDITVQSDSGRVYLGGDGVTGTYARVGTEAGVSPFVWARVS